MSGFPHSRRQFRIEQFLLGREIATLWRSQDAYGMRSHKSDGLVSDTYFTSALTISCAQWKGQVGEKRTCGRQATPGRLGGPQLTRPSPLSLETPRSCVPVATTIWALCAARQVRSAVSPNHERVMQDQLSKEIVSRPRGPTSFFYAFEGSDPIL
jgi:hypothetical protein